MQVLAILLKKLYILQMILEAQNISFSYAKGINTLTDIHFTLQKGEILCICGANGSGKSTLLQILAGIIEVQHGKVITDLDISEQSALLFQDPDMQILGQDLYEDMLIQFPNPSAEQKNKSLELLKQFGLLEKKNAPVDELSFGQKRKLALASSLMSSPALLLLDEPSSFLDYPALRELRTHLKHNKSQGITQCIVAHDIELYVDIADSLLLLNEGTQEFFGTIEEGLNYIENNPSFPVKLPYRWKEHKKILPW